MLCNKKKKKIFLPEKALIDVIENTPHKNFGFELKTSISERKVITVMC